MPMAKAISLYSGFHWGWHEHRKRRARFSLGNGTVENKQSAKAKHCSLKQLLRKILMACMNWQATSISLACTGRFANCTARAAIGRTLPITTLTSSYIVNVAAFCVLLLFCLASRWLSSIWRLLNGSQGTLTYLSCLARP